MGSTSSEIAPGQFVKHVRAGTHAVLTIPTGLLPTDDEVIGVKVTRIDRLPLRRTLHFRNGSINIVSNVSSTLPLLPRFRTYRCVVSLGDQIG